jgi:hypothetical protein
MKKIIIFLFSVILTMNCVNAQIKGDFCEITIFMWNTGGGGWYPNSGIEITVDGVDYGIIKLPQGFEIYEGEETVLIPSGEVFFSWKGQFSITLYGFEIYNSHGELIYTSPVSLPAGLFFTYQNECPHYVECLPITDLEGAYNPDIKQVNLTWIAPESVDLTGFDIFRNDSVIDHLTPSTTFYSDNTEELGNGDYTYCVIPVYPFECDLEDKCLEVPIYVGIRNYASTIDIYPNPASNELRITNYELRIQNVELFDVFGKCHASCVTRHENEAKVDVSSLHSGIYFVKIMTEQSTISKKIIIQK